MKKIVRGNDFTLRIPVKKIVNGEQVSFPLTDCTDIAVHVVSKYKRTALPYTIDKESNDVLLADVDGTTLSLGTYALEVTGVLEGANWRSYEYEQFAIVDNNASSDTVFEDNTADGDTGERQRRRNITLGRRRWKRALRSRVCLMAASKNEILT